MADNFDLWRTTLPDERKPKDFWGLLRAQEAGLSAIILGIMADYFFGTPKNTGNFDVFAAGSAQGYIRNYGVVLFPWLVTRPKHLDS